MRSIFLKKNETPQEGPNVVHLSPEDAYFFIMNMFVHDPCIHDFSLQGLGGSRADIAGQVRCASTVGGGGHCQVGGENTTDMLPGIVDASTIELLRNDSVSEVAKQPTYCDVENVLNTVFEENYTKKGINVINDAELNKLEGCLQKAQPGITKYSIIDFGLKKGIKFSDNITSDVELLKKATEKAEREVDEEQKKNNLLNAEREGNESLADAKEEQPYQKGLVIERANSLIDSDKLENIKGIINYAISMGEFTQEDCNDIYNIMNLEPELKEEIQRWLQNYGKMQGGGIINDITNTFKKIYSPIRQKGGASYPPYDYPIAAAKMFANSILFFKQPDARVNGTWFTTPYVPTQNILLKFENEFATKLIRAIKYFNPDATDEDFITQTDRNNINTTTFDISEELLTTTVKTINGRFGIYNSLDVSFNDLPPNIIKTKTEDSFYLYKTSINNLVTDHGSFYSKLPEIFSNEMFDAFSLDNDKIKDENNAIKVLFFLYELANILVIYNYIYYINDSKTILNKNFGILKDGGTEWISMAGSSGDNPNKANAMGRRAISNFIDLKGERYMLNIVLERPDPNLGLDISYDIIEKGINYIKVLQDKIMNLSTGTSKLQPREANILDFCLDCITHSVVTPLKQFYKGTSEKVLFYDQFIGHGNNRKYRASGRDQIIMRAFLNTFFSGSGTDPEPSVSNYIATAPTAFPSQPTIYIDKDDAKSIPSFDNTLKDQLVRILNKNHPINNPNIIYINNAAQNIYHGRDDVGTTNIASVIDPQSTFPKFKTKGGNIELGNMDITIKTQNSEIFYRIRVTVINFDAKDNITVKIEAYLKIGNEVLVYLEGDDNGNPLPNPPAHAPIIINTADNNPLQANRCFGHLVKQVTDLFNNNSQRTNVAGTVSVPQDQGGKIQPTQVYRFLCNDGLNGWMGGPVQRDNPSECRRLIVEAAFQKGLGDFLQEVLGWAPNRGYTQAPPPAGADGKGTRNRKDYNIFSPTVPFVVMQLNNDTPSGLRAMFFNSLRAKQLNDGTPFWYTPAGMPPPYHSICGYLSNVSFLEEENGKWTKQWTPKYVVSICTVPARIGGGKKRKTRKKRRVKYSTIRRKSKKTRRSRRKRKKRRRHTTRN